MISNYSQIMKYIIHENCETQQHADQRYNNITPQRNTKNFGVFQEVSLTINPFFSNGNLWKNEFIYDCVNIFLFKPDLVFLLFIKLLWMECSLEINATRRSRNRQRISSLKAFLTFDLYDWLTKHQFKKTRKRKA